MNNTTLLQNSIISFPEEILYIVAKYITRRTQQFLGNTRVFYLNNETYSNGILFPLLFVCHHFRKTFSSVYTKSHNQCYGYASVYAFLGNVSLLSWSVDNNFSRINGKTCFYASVGGSLDVLRWLKIKRYPINLTVIGGASMGGHVEILEWAKSIKCGISTHWASASAAEYGHLEVLKWLKKNNFKIHRGTCLIAIKHNHLEVMKWLESIGYQLPKEFCEIAER